MKITYHQNDLRLFEGFYESNLFNSDSLYDSETEWDIDFKKFQLEVCRKITNEIESDLYFIDNCPIKSMDFESIYSPRYYNYETDKMNIKINVDMRVLKKYIKQNRDSLQNYLTDCYTSTSGFISFVPTQIDEFLEWDSLLRNDIIIDWYLVSNLDLDSIKFRSAEIAYECLEVMKYEIRE